MSQKKVLAVLNISRSLLYYKRKQESLDLEVKAQIEAAMVDNPAYGHKRIALALKLNKKRILRVMNKYELKPYRRRRNPRKRADENKIVSKFKNLIKGMYPTHPEVVWVSDFTYIRYQGKFIYVATVMDMFTREIVGVRISRYHSKELVMGALKDAVTKRGRPTYLHSDQGSEYDSQDYTEFAEVLGVRISMSRKGSPWENGYQESFYSQFKLELADQERFKSLGELTMAIYEQIDYYNYRRIHTALKMPPCKFRESLYS